jgi:hypothetical protein
MKRTLLVLVAAAAALVAMVAAAVAARGSGDGVARTSYVGRVSGTPVVIGVVTDGRQMLAYSCDSKSFGTGFAGTLHDGRATLRARDGSILALAVRGRDAAGTLTIAGRALRFVAHRTTGAHGVYRAAGPIGRDRVAAVGWVLGPDGIAGVTRITSTAAGTVSFEPAPALRPDAATVDIHGAELALQRVNAPTKELQRVWVTDPA